MQSEYDAAKSIGKAYSDALLRAEMEEAKQHAFLIACRMGLNEPLAKTLVEQIAREHASTFAAA